MDFVFVMMKGTTIMAVDCVDLETEGMTVAQAAAKLAAELAEEVGEAPTAYAVLGDSPKEVWLLQQVTKLRS